MRIKRAALIGAGAVGSWFIPGLSMVLGKNFYVIASGERAERLKNAGIVINGRVYDGDNLNIRSAEEAGALGIDLLLVAVKYDNLQEVLYDIRTIVEERRIFGTTDDAEDAMDDIVVVSCLNGINAEEIIAAEIGEKQILPAFMRVVSRKVGNAIRYNPYFAQPGGLIFGEKDTEEKTPRCEAVEHLLHDAGIGCLFVGDIMTRKWQKFAMNIANNLPQAILSVGFGAYCDSAHVAYIHDCLYAETMIVASKYGVKFEPEENTPQMAPADARFSTLQDLDAGRHTEIEMLAGVLMDKAEAVGVAVPFAEYTYHLIRALEEKNDGLFDYE
jgi:2-dehydropantoate 2-reductase